MAELPFLVVHGWWIAKLLVIACGALGLVVIRALRRRAERKDIEMQLLARTGALCGLEVGPVSVRGQLRGRAVTTFALDGTPARERSETVTIEVEGRPVEVRGDIDVVRGSQARASYRRGRTFTVADGDEVIAKGTLAHVAGDGGDYRESAGEWVLEGPTEVFAARAAIRPPALHPMRLATYFALYAGIGYCLLWGIGASLVSASKVDDDEPRQEHLAAFGKLALASALPHVRGDALEGLDRQLEFDFVHTEETEQLVIDLAGVRHGCGARAGAEIHALRFDDALATARACGDKQLEGEALAYLGRYEEAAAISKAPDVAIAAGRWADAAAAAERELEVLKKGPRTDPAIEARLERRMQCFALWFHSKAGDTSARSKLAELAHDNTACTIAYDLTMPVDQRAALLFAAADDDREGELGESILAQALAWSYGHPDSSSFASDTFQSIEALTGRTSFDRFLWLGKVAAAARPDDPIALGRDAALAALEGDLDRAKREISAAMTRSDPEAVSELEPLAQAIDLHEPGNIPPQHSDFPHPAVAPLVAVRNGTPPAELDVITSECDAELRAAFTTAAHGDGGPLAELLGRCRMLFDANVGFVLAVAPRVTQHRAELSAQLRAFHDGFGPSTYGAPFSIIVEAAARRDLARLTGDEATAARWQHIISAQAKLLSDRDKVEALLLWNEL